MGNKIKAWIKKHNWLYHFLYALTPRGRIRRYVERTELTQGLNQEKRDTRITVTMASIPPRFPHIDITLKSLLLQTVKPDRIVVHVAVKEQDLPENMRAFTQYGVEYRFVEDIGPHKKWYYSMQEFPDDILITVDDDMIYGPNLIRDLMRGHEVFPDCVICRGAHGIRLDRELNTLPITEWNLGRGVKGCRSFLLYAFGGEGVLYPPHSMDERVFDKEVFMRETPFEDDAWLFYMGHLKGTKIVRVPSFPTKYGTVDNTQGVALTRQNFTEGDGCERSLRNLERLYGKISQFQTSEVSGFSWLRMWLIYKIKRNQKLFRFLYSFTPRGKIERSVYGAQLKYGLNTDKRDGPEIIVSMTTYPPRYATIAPALKSLLLQTVRPDKIIVWVAEQDGITDQMREFEQYGVTFRFVKDLRSHKKWYYVMQEYPEAIVITVDDDVIYGPNMIGDLMRGHRKHPQCVICRAAHRITYDENGEVRQVMQWKLDETEENHPSFHYWAYGGQGILYPPHCLDPRAFDPEAFMELSPTEDDAWLLFMGHLKGTKIVRTSSKPYMYPSIQSSQTVALSRQNCFEGRTVETIQRLENRYGKLADYRD